MYFLAVEVTQNETAILTCGKGEFKLNKFSKSYCNA